MVRLGCARSLDGHILLSCPSRSLSSLYPHSSSLYFSCFLGRFNGTSVLQPVPSTTAALRLLCVGGKGHVVSVWAIFLPCCLRGYVLCAHTRWQALFVFCSREFSRNGKDVMTGGAGNHRKEHAANNKLFCSGWRGRLDECLCSPLFSPPPPHLNRAWTRPHVSYSVIVNLLLCGLIYMVGCFNLCMW